MQIRYDKLHTVFFCFVNNRMTSGVQGGRARQSRAFFAAAGSEKTKP